MLLIGYFKGLRLLIRHLWLSIIGGLVTVVLSLAVDERFELSQDIMPVRFSKPLPCHSANLPCLEEGIGIEPIRANGPSLFSRQISAPTLRPSINWCGWKESNLHVTRRPWFYRPAPFLLGVTHIKLAQWMGFEPMNLSDWGEGPAALATCISLLKTLLIWCRWRDSNSQSRRHWSLNPACIPIPPHRHKTFNT